MRKYRVPFYIRLLDFYLKSPVLIDIILVSLLVFIISVLNNLNFIEPLNNNLIKSLNSDLISISITLAGFVLAALTIIVTFKDSSGVTEKDDQNPINGRALFFAFSFLSSFYNKTTW